MDVTLLVRSVTQYCPHPPSFSDKRNALYERLFVGAGGARTPISIEFAAIFVIDTPEFTTSNVLSNPPTPTWPGEVLCTGR